MPGQSADEHAIAMLSAGVQDPLGNRVHVSKAAIREVQRDHPEATAERILAAVCDPQAVWEHARWQDSLIYERTFSLPIGRARLMVIGAKDAPTVVHILTAFFPTREGYWTQNVGRKVWPDAS